jgi:hypothetical protein
MDMTFDNNFGWRRNEAKHVNRWYVGWDIGQSIDPSALCVLNHRVLPLNKWITNHDAKVTTQERTEHFDVLHLERLALGTPYPQQIQHVLNLMQREPLQGARAQLVIDFTGVGRPVFDMCQRAGLKPHGVLITAGSEVTRSGGTIWHVPKQILISQLEARIHSGELKWASNIADSGALTDELKDFARKVSESGRVTFNARSGSHDDLVLSLAIALFAALGGRNEFSREPLENVLKA